MDLLQSIEKQGTEETAIWLLGGATVAVRAEGCVTYIDPFFGPSTNPLWTRRFEPLIDPSRIRKADYVLITHEHRDHCNETTLRVLEENLLPEYFMPASSMAVIQEEYGLHIDPVRVHMVRPGERFSRGDLKFTVFDSSDKTARKAVSYLVHTRDGKIFHAGDSLYVPGFFAELREIRVDVALLPLGENPEGWNVYPGQEDFIGLAREIGARLTVPIHWDLWEESYLDARCVEKGLKETEIRVIQRGERISLPLKRGSGSGGKNRPGTISQDM